MEDSGYSGTEITVEIDQEESIVALRKAIAAARIGDTVPINSPVRCHKANGRCEGSVRIWQGQLRVLKHYFEAMVKRQMPSTCAMFSWLITWAADIMNKFKV